MDPVVVTQGATGVLGHWKIIVKAPGLPPKDVTFFRGVPTEIGTWDFSDPYGAKSATLTFPHITMLEAFGQGDIDWLVPTADFDILWVGPLPAGMAEFAWEGYAIDFGWSTGKGIEVTLQGACYQMDNYLAKPEYPSRPITYERAIKRQFQGRPDLRMGALKIEFPPWWASFFDPHGYTYSFQIPTGVSPGDAWTGLLTRNTGAWEPSLTSYITSLLATMYTKRGRWTIDLDRHRLPVMRHRDIITDPNATTLIVDPALPGVECTFSYDYSQTLNVAYGQGKTLSGTGYSGMNISGDGLRTTYEPLAHLRQVYPTSDRNHWLQPERMRKETLIQMQDGLELEDARGVGEFHLDHFSDPGITGTITLAVDPVVGTGFLHRGCIKAGFTVQVLGVFGRPFGALMQVTEVSYDPSTQTSTLTVDTKYRDALTLNEVRLRGRDSLAITRSLLGGQYQPPVPDQLLPWNYAEGSGFIPSGKGYSSVNLFKGIPDEVEFPWTEWTTAHPPSSKAWRNAYMRIGPTSTNADLNWAVVPHRDGDIQGSPGEYGFPIKMAQAGSIRMLQIAAYDANGHLLAVPFHFSLYKSSGVNVESMPMLQQTDIDAINKNIDALNASTTPAGTTPHTSYLPGQHYPFFPAAWERYNINGTAVNRSTTVEAPGAGFVRGYGTGLIQAGFWPGSSSLGDNPTGMLVDETTFTFDTQGQAGDYRIDPLTTKQIAQYAGYMHGMIFCEAQKTQPVYFLGRMFRVEPGQVT